MANTKISQLTPNTNPTGNEELVYAYNNSNGKMSLNTMKTFANTGQQAALVSGTNIKTINNQSILGPGNIDIQGGGGGGADASYDAIVDASGNGDYTLVSAAIAAGNFNIFVKNGSYTETAGWDAYTKSSSFLRIIGESKKGVQITMPNTITLANNKIIDMRYGTGANFYMENISFDINFPSNTVFLDYNAGTNNNVVIKNCSFTYAGTGADIFDEKITVYDCDFISNTSGYVNICSDTFTCHGCNFSSQSGCNINFSSSNDEVYIYNSVIDTYGLGIFSNPSGHHTDLNLHNSSLTVKEAMGELELNQVVDSYVKINDLAVPPTINCAVASNSSIDVSGNSIGFGYTDYHGNRGVVNCEINAGAIINPVNMKGCYITASTFKTSSNCIVIGCEFSSSTAISMANNNSLFVGNIAKGTATFDITGNYSIVVGNQMRQRSITDSSTGSIKDNNITA